MILYLAKQYLYNTLGIVSLLAVIPVLVGTDIVYSITRALFWGGLFGVFYMVHYLKKRDIWPIYDNLRYPAVLLLFLFFAGLQLVNGVIWSLL